MADLVVQDAELRRIFADENENDFEGFSANEIMRDNFDSDEEPEIADYIDEHDPDNEADDDQMRCISRCMAKFSRRCNTLPLYQ